MSTNYVFNVGGELLLKAKRSKSKWIVTVSIMGTSTILATIETISPKSILDLMANINVSDENNITTVIINHPRSHLQQVFSFDTTTRNIISRYNRTMS